MVCPQSLLPRPHSLPPGGTDELETQPRATLPLLEGILRRRLMIAGKSHDAAMYSLLAKRTNVGI